MVNKPSKIGGGYVGGGGVHLLATKSKTKPFGEKTKDPMEHEVSTQTVALEYLCIYTPALGNNIYIYI